MGNKGDKDQSKPKTFVLSTLAVGNSNTGKTTLLQQYHGRIDLSQQQMYYVISKTVLISKKDIPCKVKLWDSSGSERFNNVVVSRMKSTDGIMIVFDITNKESFNDLPRYIEMIKGWHEIKKFPVVLIGNKSDLQREVSKDEAQKFAKKNGIKYFETSATTSDGINEPLDYLIGLAYKKKK